MPRTRKKKPLTSGDHVGYLCRLRRDIRTRGGTEFPAGTVLYCGHHWRGRLSLDDLDASRSVTRVHTSDVRRVTDTPLMGALSSALNKLERAKGRDRAPDYWRTAKKLREELTEEFKRSQTHE